MLCSGCCVRIAANFQHRLTSAKCLQAYQQASSIGRHFGLPSKVTSVALEGSLRALGVRMQHDIAATPARSASSSRSHRQQQQDIHSHPIPDVGLVAQLEASIESQLMLQRTCMEEGIPHGPIDYALQFMREQLQSVLQRAASFGASDAQREQCYSPMAIEEPLTKVRTVLRLLVCAGCDKHSSGLLDALWQISWQVHLCPGMCQCPALLYSGCGLLPRRTPDPVY